MCGGRGVRIGLVGLGVGGQGRGWGCAVRIRVGSQDRGGGCQDKVGINSRIVAMKEAKTKIAWKRSSHFFYLRKEMLEEKRKG